ncbi:RNA polymerase sigma factor [Nocardioides daejeonensis]|uniref:RNA polymerase sigma factor n=1 Tax=Nocardioides daejeonensis TaxID=1046556 RepID=UPI001EF4854A|nr:sigma-70 family RNA polymerase sigma factor [Nocardioides daejeonensis]
MNPGITSEVQHAVSSDEEWIADLHRPGAVGVAAQRRLHELLLRAARHQVARLRHQLPGIGAGELDDLAQEAANDALMSVLAKLDTFEGRSRFTTWVYKFGVLHAGVTVRRQAWRHREVHLPDTFTIVAQGATPAADAEAGELARELEKAIANDLTPHQRRITLALLIEHVPIDVLADRLGTSRNALYKTLHDARQRLRAALIRSGHLDATTSRSTR